MLESGRLAQVTGVLHIWNLISAAIWYTLLSRRVERLGDKRQENVAAAFVIGGIVSIGLTTFFYYLYPRGLGWFLAQTRLSYNIGVVGLVEEAAKFLSFLLIVKLAAPICEPQDGVILGAVVGMTFGVIENFDYIETYGGHWFIWLRPIISSGGHATYGAIWGGIYSQAIYANSFGDDRGASLRALIGVPLVALIHGLYNWLTWILPLSVLLDALSVLLAIAIYRRSVELSPYRVYPLEMAKTAVDQIRRGLVYNPKSPILNRHAGLYLMHMGKYRAAAHHFKASMPRSRDSRRARFLSVCCEMTYVPRVKLMRSLRIAWSRLSDQQRRDYLVQLEKLVGDRDGIRRQLDEFLGKAFEPRKYKNSREIAYEQKLKRILQKHRRVGESTAGAIAAIDGEERARMARRLRGGS